MKRLIQILVSVILLGLLIYWTDFNQVKKSLAEANYVYLLLAIGVITFDRFLMAGKWGLLLKAKNITMNIFDLTKIYYIANYLGLFLPPTIGTDIVRTFYVIKKNHSTIDVIASIVVERIMGFLALFFAALLGFIFFIQKVALPEGHADNFFIIILILCIGGSILFFLSFNESFMNKTLQVLRSFERFHFIKKIVTKLEKLVESYHSYKNYKLALIIFLLLTFLETFTVVLWSYIVSVALNLNVPFTYFIAFIPILLVLVRLPFSIDGFGLNEGSYVYFLSLIGIQSAVAFSVGFITHIITIIGILPGAVFYVFNSKLKEIRPSLNAVIDKTLDGIIISWNMGAELLYGYSAQETIGKYISIIIPEERLKEREAYQKKLLQGEKINIETERIRKDGSRVQISLFLSPIMNSDGKIIIVSTTERDITTTKLYTH